MTSRPTGRGQRVEVTGGDSEGHPFFYLKQVRILRIISPHIMLITQVTFVAKDTISSHDTEPIWLLHHGGGKIKIIISFQGHYNEPDLTIDFSSVRGQST